MNGSRVRDGEGRFITFVFFFIDKKGDSIENNKIKGYKSTLTTPHPGPCLLYTSDAADEL